MPEERMEIIIRPGDAVLKEDDTDIISKYINPNPKCLCCNEPKLALLINKAYLNGMSYTQIVTKYKEECLLKTGKILSVGLLSDHFTTHFNINGVAIAEYNRKYGLSNLQQSEQGELKDVFSALVNDKVHDLELLDLAMREQIKRMKELEDIKAERIKEGKTNNIDQIIMKQEVIMNNLQSQLLSKLKLWQRSQIQSKQLEIMDRQLQFLDHKTANFLGLDPNITLEPMLAKEAERLYLKIVIENLIKRVKKALDSLVISTQDKGQYLKELQRQFNGIEKEIDLEFQDKIKNLKNIGK
jgi:hypothetical protein